MLTHQPALVHSADLSSLLTCRVNWLPATALLSILRSSSKRQPENPFNSSTETCFRVSDGRVKV